MNFRVLGIKAGEMTENHMLYPEHVLRDAIDKFNERAQKETIFGGIVERGSLTWETPSHQITGAEVSKEDEVFFDCATLNSEEGRKLEQILTEQKFEYLPIMEVPKNQPKTIDGVRTITEITNIEGISISLIRSDRKSDRKSDRRSEHEHKRDINPD